MKENADKARSLDAAELAKQIREAAEQTFRLKFQMSMGQMEGLKKYRSLRKERARMLTVMRERELNPSAAAEAQASAKEAAKTAGKKKAAPKKAAAAKSAAKSAEKSAAKKAPAAKKTSK